MNRFVQFSLIALALNWPAWGQIQQSRTAQGARLMTVTAPQDRDDQAKRDQDADDRRHDRDHRRHDRDDRHRRDQDRIGIRTAIGIGTKTAIAYIRTETVIATMMRITTAIIAR